MNRKLTQYDMRKMNRYIDTSHQQTNAIRKNFFINTLNQLHSSDTKKSIKLELVKNNNNN